MSCLELDFLEARSRRFALALWLQHVQETTSRSMASHSISFASAKTPVLRHLFTSAGHNYFGHYGGAPGEHVMVERTEIHCVEGLGIQGDRFFNYKKDYKGQITFFAYETYILICEKFGVRDKGPDVFRRNVVAEGVDWMQFVDAEFEIQGVRFFGTGECAPCEWMNMAFGSGAEEFLKGQGGLRAKILSSGILRVSKTWVNSVHLA